MSLRRDAINVQDALYVPGEVIAVEQPLTVELLGGAAALFLDGPAYELAGQLRQYSPVPAELRRQAAGRFSWQRFAEQIASHLQAVL